MSDPDKTPDMPVPEQPSELPVVDTGVELASNDESLETLFAVARKSEDDGTLDTIRRKRWKTQQFPLSRPLLYVAMLGALSVILAVESIAAWNRIPPFPLPPRIKSTAEISFRLPGTDPVHGSLHTIPGQVFWPTEEQKAEHREKVSVYNASRLNATILTWSSVACGLSAGLSFAWISWFHRKK